jgi:hypothetical protein
VTSSSLPGRTPPARRGIRLADPYFLGPFVYHEQRRGPRFLVDGQQRFNTIHLVCMHLQRRAQAIGKNDAFSQLDRVIRDFRDGRWHYHIDIPERNGALDALYQGREYEPPPASSLSLRNLCARSREMGEMLDANLSAEHVPAFAEWLLNCVILVGIEAPNRDSGFRIFESMNDRGTHLTPVDLLKSNLLSNIGQQEDELNRRWREMLAELTPDRDDPAGPTRFIKAALVAHHARLSEGSTDVENINGSLHVWVKRQARNLLELRTPNEFFDQVLRNDRVFDRSGFLYDRAREFIGNSLISCPHNDHRRQRRLIQPLSVPAGSPPTPKR